MKITSLHTIKETQVSHNENIKKKRLINNGDIKGITYFSKATFPAGEIANLHSHTDMTEVFFIESGEATALVDGKEHTLTAGGCIAIEPHEEHEIQNRGSEDLVLLYFGIES